MNWRSLHLQLLAVEAVETSSSVGQRLSLILSLISCFKLCHLLTPLSLSQPGLVSTTLDCSDPGLPSYTKLCFGLETLFFVENFGCPSLAWRVGGLFCFDVLVSETRSIWVGLS